MARIIRTDRAKADVISIAVRIMADSPSAADRWLEELDRILAVLASQPLIGERVEELARGVRRHCFGNFLLFYCPIEGGIELRRVLHGARRIDDLLSPN